MCIHGDDALNDQEKLIPSDERSVCPFRRKKIPASLCEAGKNIHALDTQV
jgi:hypothetical protein